MVIRGPEFYSDDSWFDIQAQWTRMYKRLYPAENSDDLTPKFEHARNTRTLRKRVNGYTPPHARRRYESLVVLDNYPIPAFAADYLDFKRALLASQFNSFGDSGPSWPLSNAVFLSRTRTYRSLMEKTKGHHATS